jgi:hypothetical protein
MLIVHVNTSWSPFASVAAGDKFASTNKLPPEEALNIAAELTVVEADDVNVFEIVYVA